uniref:Uncharacterized protein n=1 Tax=Anguilla anguilla TaxID=7936 RepID=A0A0E9SD07_ANGAN
MWLRLQAIGHYRLGSELDTLSLTSGAKFIEREKRMLMLQFASNIVRVFGSFRKLHTHILCITKMVP